MFRERASTLLQSSQATTTRNYTKVAVHSVQIAAPLPHALKLYAQIRMPVIRGIVTINLKSRDVNIENYMKKTLIRLGVFSNIFKYSITSLPYSPLHIHKTMSIYWPAYNLEKFFVFYLIYYKKTKHIFQVNNMLQLFCPYELQKSMSSPSLDACLDLIEQNSLVENCAYLKSGPLFKLM